VINLGPGGWEVSIMAGRFFLFFFTRYPQAKKRADKYHEPREQKRYACNRTCCVVGALNVGTRKSGDDRSPALRSSLL